MNIEQLIADLRARINPQYYDQVGTESYERHQVVKALEYLATENERLKELMAKRTREHQQEMTSFRLRVRSQDDATFAALRDEVNGLTGSLDRADKALKEAQEQHAVAWMIHEYQGTGEKRLQFQPHIPSIRDAVTGPIVTALYARPVPAAPAVAVPAVPSGWNIRRDGDVLIVQHPDIGGCSVQKEPDWERMIPEAILYSLADALLQSRAVKDPLTTQADCRTCANRGQVNGLSQESYCDSCVYEGRGWRQNHFVDASKTADAVKRRCEACAILPCSCK